MVLEAQPWWQVASAALGFALMAGVALIYRKLRGRDGLGLGDAKLLAAAGAWLGAEALPSVPLWACGSAVLALLLRAWRAAARSAEMPIPFAPSLAFGVWLVWLYGPLGVMTQLSAGRIGLIARNSLASRRAHGAWSRKICWVFGDLAHAARFQAAASAPPGRVRASRLYAVRVAGG